MSPEELETENKHLREALELHRKATDELAAQHEAAIASMKHDLDDETLTVLSEELGRELVRLTGVALEGGTGTVGDARRDAMRTIIREVDAARGRT